jgi:hypothetical protein
MVSVPQFGQQVTFGLFIPSFAHPLCKGHLAQLPDLSGEYLNPQAGQMTVFSLIPANL